MSVKKISSKSEIFSGNFAFRLFLKFQYNNPR